MIAIETQIRLHSSVLLSCAPDYSATWTTRLLSALKFHSESPLTHTHTPVHAGRHTQIRALKEAAHIY